MDDVLLYGIVDDAEYCEIFFLFVEVADKFESKVLAGSFWGRCQMTNVLESFPFALSKSFDLFHDEIIVVNFNPYFQTRDQIFIYPHLGALAFCSMIHC